MPRNAKQDTAEPASAYQNPASLHEYIVHTRADTVLAIWREQSESDRRQRELIAIAIFVLLYFEVIALTSLLVLVGLNWISLSTDFFKVAFPSLMAQTVGLGLVVTRSLFDTKLRLSLDELLSKLEHVPAVARSSARRSEA